MKLKKTKEGMVVMSKKIDLQKSQSGLTMSMLYAKKDLKLHQNNCDMKHAKSSAKNVSPLRMQVLVAALKSMPLIKTFTKKSNF